MLIPIQFGRFSSSARLFSKGGKVSGRLAMGAELRRDDMEVAEEDISDSQAFRFVEHVLQSVRMVWD